MKKQLQAGLMIILGSLLYGFGFNYFIAANHLAEGGVSGLALLFYYATNFPVSYFIVLVNIPLLLIGWYLWGLSFVGKSIFGVAATALSIELCSHLQLPVDNLLLPALYGGLVTGAGLGLIIRNGATTGGTDIIGRILNQFFGISMGRFYLLFDMGVLILTAAIHGLEIALYSLVTVYVASKIVDLVIDGLDAAKQAIIISPKTSEILNFIIKDMERGATVLNGRGGYLANPTDVILCVVSRNQIFRLRKGVSEIDPQAFIIISNAYEIYGDGFREHK
ncbi:MAG: YitT family protein [Peptococcaceae bacterium]|nr:YitT family protein [Peptococcaceae bacterium]